MDPARNANLTSQDDGKVLFDAPQDDVGMHATWITTCMTTCIGKHNEPSVLGSTELAQMRQDDSDNTVTISMDSTPSQRQPSRGRAQSESLFKIHLIVAWFSHKILSVSRGVSC